jgi:tRNA pseudouridine38-40 synthase
MRTIKLTIAYDGTDFVGWQIQPNGESVQAALTRALREMTGSPDSIVGSGRTDAGVHALGQVASFTTDAGIPLEGFVKGLNSLLPPQVAVLSAEEAEEGFDAQRSARGKVYRYLILRSPHRVPHMVGRAWHLRETLDVGAMREAAGHLVGEHDFESFRASGCAAEHAVRRIDGIGISEEGEGPDFLGVAGPGSIISLTFEGSGFVRHMIRNIVGTLVGVGRGDLAPKDVGRILESRQRKEAGVCAPASGLYLVRVIY